MENFASKVSPSSSPYFSRMTASDMNCSVMLFFISDIVRAIILSPV
ncbi:hypothetical protein EVA_06026 [gut metagenome]|uniref:Uncharacterized protein n=1 Tax=gut metagenome TaxID=749906 RepID=J9GT38_9ZZZZ